MRTNPPRGKDQDLERFVEMDEKSRQVNGTVIEFIIAASYHGISLIVGYFVYSYSWRTFMLPTHAFIFIVSLIAMRLKFKVDDTKVIVAGSLKYILMLGFGLSTFLTRITPGVPNINIVSGEALMLVVASFSLLLASDGEKHLRIRSILYVLIMSPGIFFLVGEPLVDWLILTFPGFVAGAYFLRRRFGAHERQAARSEFLRLRSFAPQAIMRRSLETNRSIEALFSPEERFCVCICSDWRNYQKLTSTMTPTEVVNALEVYYKSCNSLLDTCFPKGNYFSDWIADELFVVGFCDDGMSESEVALAGVNFARQLLNERASIAAITGAPKGIDVGIAAGHASVGIMGPEGNRKATALGEIPGRARRLQTAAKGLRVHRGDSDRVVIGEEVTAMCGPIEGLKSFQLEGEALRDLAEKTLHFVDCDRTAG